MLTECEHRLWKARLLDLPCWPPIMDALCKLSATDVDQGLLPAELWPLYKLKVLVPLTHSARQHLHNVRCDKRVPCEPSL